MIDRRWCRRPTGRTRCSPTPRPCRRSSAPRCETSRGDGDHIGQADDWNRACGEVVVPTGPIGRTGCSPTPRPCRWHSPAPRCASRQRRWRSRLASRCQLLDRGERSVVVPSPNWPYSLSPPRPDRAVALQRHGVTSAGSDGDHAVQAGDLDRGRGGRWWCRRPIGRIVVPPRPDRAVALQRHGVKPNVIREAIAMTSFRPRTCTGVERSVVVPSPNWPTRCPPTPRPCRRASAPYCSRNRRR